MSNLSVKLKKWFLLVILVLLFLLVGLGIYSYYNFNKKVIINNISVSGGKLYPEFSSDVKEYQVYTDLDEITITCDKLDGKVEGCNEKINVNDSVVEHFIITKEARYVVKVVKQDTGYSKVLKINGIEGIPSSWVNSTTIVVNVENLENIEGATYSFDGGVTWQKENSIEINANTKLEILVKDYFGYVSEIKEVIIEKIDNDKPTVVISKKNVSAGKVLLTATSIDEISGIGGYNWNNNGYSADDTLLVDKAGSYSIVVKDNAGNESQVVSIQVEEADLKKISQKEYVALFDSNGADSISKNVLKCTTEGSSCTVIAPSITRKNYNILGWSKNSNATKAEYKVGSSIKITGGEKLYAVTSKKIVASFDENGTSTIGSNSLSCNVYNRQTSCSIKVPTISRSGYNILGWSRNSNSTKSEYKVGNNIKIAGGEKLYAITFKKIVASFNKNGASSISSSNVSCNVYNKDFSCTVKLPTITAASGFEVVGWGSSASSTTKSASVGQRVSLNKNITYYAVTKSAVALKATFNKNGASSIGSSNLSCYKYNGNSSCKVKLPTIVASSGFSVIGWGDSASSISKVASVGQSVSISRNKTYYAVTKSSDYYKVTFNKNGASSISASSLNCYRYNNQSSCTVKLPTITASSGFEVVGWGNSASSTTKTASVGQSISLSKNATYYAVTKSKGAYKATFYPRVASVGSYKVGTAVIYDCYRYNGGSTCTVKTPSVNVSNGQQFLGWNTDSGATSASIKSEQSISLKSNTPYYAVVREKLTATFNKNGANSVGSSSLSCYKYNGNSSCTVKLPTITSTSGFDVIGWGSNASSTTKSASVGQSVSLSKNTTYYAVTRSKDYYKATFYPRVTSIGSYNVGTGVIYNCYRYNGGSTCTVKTPSVNVSSGQQFLGWNTDSTATSASIKSEQSISLKSNTNYYAVVREKLTATFNKNGASSIGSSSLSCYKYNGNSSCTVKLPTITATSRFDVVGWGSSASSTTKSASVGQSVSISKNTTYYAVTKSKDAYKVTFNKNGASSIGATSLNCYRYNNASSCTVKLPTITAASGFDVVGWGSSASSTAKSASVGQSVSLSKDINYYAITKSTAAYKVTFWPRTASIGSHSVGTGIVPSCYRYNGASSCNVTTPSVNLSSGQTFLGWSTNANATSSTIKNNQTVSVKADAVYYALVKETLTATYNKNGADSLSFYSSSCTSYGAGCVLTDAPRIYKKGYETWGGFSFGSTSNGSSGVINKKITSNITLYVKQQTWTDHPASLSIATTYKINGLSIDVEKSNNLPYSVYNSYYELLNNSVYKNMPYLFHYKGKIRMVSKNTYVNKLWGDSSSGVAYGYGNEYSNVDINLASNYSEYSFSTFVHELGHAFDSYYGVQTGKKLSAQTDIMKYYNKYKNVASNNRPMRDYSYSNSSEFVADAFAYYYYYKYRTNVTNPKGGNSISKDKELVKVVENYIKIAKNGYK